MKTYSALLLCLFCTAEIVFAQQLKASEVLEKAIAYHDPNGNWEAFNTAFQVTMTTPNNEARVSDITINLPDEFFKLVATRDGNKTTYTLNITTYAMEVYQFYKGDPNGAGKDTGEYILLSEESTLQEIRLPKVRAWYYNKDDAYLGTDTITN